jgi:hypothetical protein
MNIVIYKYFSPKALELAFYRVKCWNDKLVKDQVGLRAFGADLENNCLKLSNKLLEGEYKPQRGFKFYVPKSSLTNRTKTLLYIEDALVYQAIANQLAFENYHKLQEHHSFVFGSVLSPENKLGLDLLEKPEPNFFFFKFWKNLFATFKESIIHSVEVDKAKFKFETDITGFFDCIPHYNLMMVLSEQFGVEDEILDLLSQCLNIWSGTKDSITPGVGIPQGAEPSFLLANLLLHELDELIISNGFKYYRYMDDIKIYGYEKQELVTALVLIDKHLKGCGLSINSKKTSIEAMSEDMEDATVKELKKLDTFAQYLYDEEGLEVIDTFTLDDIENDKQTDKHLAIHKELEKASGLAEQESQSFLEVKIDERLTEEADIINFLEEQLAQVDKELPALFKDASLEIDKLEVEEEKTDIDFIRMSAQFGTNFNKIKALKPHYKANDKLLKYWLFSYKKFFWRANNFGLSLAHYRNNAQIKSFLLNLIQNDFTHYEWSRYMAIQTLSISHEFDDKELRQIYFKMLLNDESDLVKIALYRLLYRHAKSKQFTSTLNKQLQKESNWYLKVLITDFNKNQKNEDIDIVEFINSIGL